MAHAILISADISVKTRLKKYIKTREVIRGAPFHVTYTITNVGKTKFPGGKVKKMVMTFQTAGGVTQTSTQEIEIPSLNPTHEDTFEKVFSTPTTGMGWLSITIEAADGQPIEYYQFYNVKLDENEWRIPIYAIEREVLQIVDLLQQLVKRG